MVLSAITEASGASVLFTGDNFTRLLGGLGTSITVAGLALLVGIPLGIILGALRILRNPVLRAVLRLYLEFFRIVPTLVLLFLTYYILPRELGVQVDGVTVAVVTFGLWVAAEISDIVRGSLISVSDHQVDAGKALGMNGLQVLWYVRIPQSINLMVPATINLAARVIMTTSLLLLISVIDVITVGPADHGGQPYDPPGRRILGVRIHFPAVFHHLLAAGDDRQGPGEASQGA